MPTRWILAGKRGRHEGLYNPSKETLVIGYDMLDLSKGGPSGSAATALALIGYVVGWGRLSDHAVVTAEIDLKGQLKSVGGLGFKAMAVMQQPGLEAMVVARRGYEEEIKLQGEVRRPSYSATMNRDAHSCYRNGIICPILSTPAGG